MAPGEVHRGDGREIMLCLIDGVDVIVENFRPGILDRRGFGHDAVVKRKPAMIHAFATGLGASGPMRDPRRSPWRRLIPSRYVRSWSTAT